MRVFVDKIIGMMDGRAMRLGQSAESRARGADRARPIATSDIETLVGRMSEETIAILAGAADADLSAAVGDIIGSSIAALR